MDRSDSVPEKGLLSIQYWWICIEKSEAQRDIDSILQRLKPVRPLRAIDLQNEVEIDEMIGKLTDTMREAAMNDRKLNKEGNPAIAKLKLLPQFILIYMELI